MPSRTAMLRTAIADQLTARRGRGPRRRARRPPAGRTGQRPAARRCADGTVGLRPASRSWPGPSPLEVPVVVGHGPPDRPLRHQMGVCGVIHRPSCLMGQGGPEVCDGGGERSRVRSLTCSNSARTARSRWRSRRRRSRSGPGRFPVSIEYTRICIRQQAINCYRGFRGQITRAAEPKPPPPPPSKVWGLFGIPSV
jgi:hypothetical protein